MGRGSRSRSPRRDRRDKRRSRSPEKRRDHYLPNQDYQDFHYRPRHRSRSPFSKELTSYHERRRRSRSPDRKKKKDEFWGSEKNKHKRSKSRSRTRSPSKQKQSSSATSNKAASKSKKKKKEEEVQMDEDGDEKDPTETEMMKMMGFSTFDTTKNKKVVGNQEGDAHILLKRKYRQYMNRKGGFNRPLDPIT
ncbi:DgyrCDS3444 [Dimorphilus gyrociliatus]|uniref:U4/U6.U5 small nuclear ribonucleoprotein 27 kDa protein n=1 Tax=Dimorphilus gyrociliatus TaxID=2664684 RepID=A0A7I8VD89_9ANNE|nr:DgyrCDS3444 [Dimorphilus gyrociliatus]